MQNLSGGPARLVKRGEIGAVVLVDGRRNGDDDDVAVGKRVLVAGEGQVFCRAQILGGCFERQIDAGHEHVETFLFEIESDGVEFFAEFNGERKSDVAEADNPDFDASRV